MSLASSLIAARHTPAGERLLTGLKLSLLVVIPALVVVMFLNVEG